MACQKPQDKVTSGLLINYGGMGSFTQRVPDTEKCVWKSKYTKKSHENL